ncbi:DUF551 domain-containing protein [Fulvimarina endophytica]|uniref:DUF551 domain-containing protein n=1 Tax=Fulvimarina endophytica TaxID=2293836 RepID=A0A371XBR4_9HYPH|nr:DUF551 domain-containing protein [Fulvimarina endophytica]RFC66494.1 DUF551 domain-containing protein [Fulvimarina endophytica]
MQRDDARYCAGANAHIEIGGLCERHVEELRAHARKLQQMMADNSPTYPAPADGWVCFHCGLRFTTGASAEAHFGCSPAGKPVCLATRAARSDALADALREACKIIREHVETGSVLWSKNGEMEQVRRWEALASHEQGKSVEGWNSDMNAAPRDGTPIVTVVWFSQSFDGDMTPEYRVLAWDVLEDSGWCDQDGNPVDDHPTHWMPLPAAPTQEGNQDGR